MRRVPFAAAVLVLLASCTSLERPLLSPTFDQASDLSLLSLPAVRISEIHYDNAGTDAGEAIEVSGPAGMDVTGWRIVLYNGNGGATYEPTRTLSGTFPATCGERGVLVQNYPVNGIQNGSPDGIALVDPTGAVVEFLSYEGTFTAVGGPANSMTATDIGAGETGSEPPGLSLQRDDAGGWNGPVAHTFGTCSEPPPPPPPPPPPLPETRFVELHYDNDGTDIAEAIEIESPAGTNLDGWVVVLYNGSGGTVYDTRALAGTIVERCGGRGVVRLTYPSNGIQNGSPDGLALVNAAGGVVEFLSYEGPFTATNGPAAGLTSNDIGVTEGSTTALGRSLQRLGTGAWQPPAPATFGACNEGDLGPAPPAILTITFTGRTTSDPELPVGFQDQLFATLVDPMRSVVTTTFTWTSDRPDLAGVDEDGVVTALGAGTAILRATAAGTTATFTMPTRIAVASTTALYAGNAEFGEPSDADASDDFIVHHDQYTASYNRNRGTPNWVSYDLDSTHFGLEDRCDCFTFDPALPPDFPRYTTADYTGAGAFAGFAIDRGHLARSFDRTSAPLDNANTFLFSNIVPQAADLNQGPWAVMENFLGDLARFSNKEVYIIAGVAGDNGTVKGEGKITIPAYTWKVALILPRDSGLASVHSYSDVAAVAVIMPNQPGIEDVNWETYKTTIDAVEVLSGYDLLARLPDPIEIAVETNTKPPTAVADGPYASLPHLAVAMSGAGSSDPDGDALTYDWSFGDGSGASGPSVSHAYASAGTFTVRLIVTDTRTLADTTFSTAVIATPQQAIGDARLLLDRLDLRDEKWLSNKLDLAAKLLDQAADTAAINQLEEFLQRLEHEGINAPTLADAVRRIIESLTS